MSISLGQLASKFMTASAKADPLFKQKLATVAKVGEGLVKSEIQSMHAVDTGTMLNSVTSEQSGNAYLIGPTVKYAPYVALGTSRMSARPFHKHAAVKLQAQIPAIIKEVELGL